MTGGREGTPIQAALELIGLRGLAAASEGAPEIRVGIIDGPVDLAHPALAQARLEAVKPGHFGACRNRASSECGHGTAIAGVLCARRGAAAPAIAPGCSYLLYPIFPEACQPGEACTPAPEVSPADLARAIVETVDAGARLINLSLGVITNEVSAFRSLEQACDYACRRNALLVTAAGNQGRMGFQALLRHEWVIPVAACTMGGAVLPESNVSPSIGARGLLAPGDAIPTTAPGARYARTSGTSIAAAMATGALALLWSARPAAPASQLRQFVLESATGRARRSIVPPLLNAQAAANLLTNTIS